MDVYDFLKSVLATAKEMFSKAQSLLAGDMSLLLPDSSPMSNMSKVSTLFREHPEYGSSIPLNVSVDIPFPVSVAQFAVDREFLSFFVL